MIERFQEFLDQPLGRGTAWAILCFFSAIVVGLALVAVLAGGGPSGPTPLDRVPSGTIAPGASLASPSVGGDQGDEVGGGIRQDPQDVSGSPAAQRAARALESHRALQHVPYKGEGLTVELVGARGHRAVLRVTASTIREARRGWREFLRRYEDAGGAYIPIFAQPGGSADG